jgi:exodeoxyribonuclease VII large subunit
MKKEIIPLTVTQLNRQVRSWLEQELGEVRVLGELSNLSKPSSGHLYFTLKDQGAQLRCVFFRNHHKQDTKQFADGQQVIAQGKLSLYEARGDYQLIVQDLVQTGLGDLYLQFERLKAKLEQQGLFASARKKPLPLFPTSIAIITSSSGAALRDILSTLARRYPLANIFLYPSEVQGKGAAQQLINAIRQANADAKADVIILARGGGSLEDLWSFNDENLALAISQSQLPIVSGVGHETDFTIADFVADWRAATPTAAAEAVTPDQIDLLNTLQGLDRRIQLATQKSLQYYQLILSHLLAKLASPEQLISKHWQTLDYLERRLHQQMAYLLNNQKHRVHHFYSRLQSNNPTALLQRWQSRLNHLEQQLWQNMTQRIQEQKQRFSQLITTLHAVSPLATLERGYAIATKEKHIIFSGEQVRVGDNIKVQLAKGQLDCQVDKIRYG